MQRDTNNSKLRRIRTLSDVSKETGIEFYVNRKGDFPQIIGFLLMMKMCGSNSYEDRNDTITGFCGGYYWDYSATLGVFYSNFGVFLSENKPLLPRTSGQQGLKLRQHRTIASADISGSFAPILQFEKLEIHPVFLRFPNFISGQNLSPLSLAELCGAALIRNIPDRNKKSEPIPGREEVRISQV